MKVALFSSNESINKLFIENLFTRGITIYSSQNIKEYLSIILNKPVYCLFLDIDVSGINWIKLIETVKVKKAPENVFTVIMTASMDKTYINQLIQLGINGVFDKKKSLKGYLAKIEQLLLFFESEMEKSGGCEKRKYARIRLGAEEEIFANMEIAGKEHLGYFKCRVIDLSIKAIAFCIEDDKLLKLISGDSRGISNIQIIIMKKVYFCEAEIVRSKGRVAVASFKNTTDMFTMGIANFIYEKINH